MTSVLVDTSVLIKWFHHAGEDDVPEARAIRDAHQRGDIDALILDLAVYEVGNVLVRALKWEAESAADQLSDLLAICGTPLGLTQDWIREAARVAVQHGFSFYDGAWVAAAEGLGVPLISADAALIRAGRAESIGDAAERLDLT